MNKNSIYSFEESRTISQSATKFTPVPKQPHNSNTIKNAEGKAKYNRKNPSELDRKMMDLLNSQNIRYEFQKVIYIKSSGGFIKQYYIVDFYIPSRDIIIDVRAKKPDVPYPYGVEKKRIIKKAYPLYTVLEWYGYQFGSVENMKQLVSLLKG